MNEKKQIKRDKKILETAFKFQGLCDEMTCIKHKNHITGEVKRYLYIV